MTRLESVHPELDDRSFREIDVASFDQYDLLAEEAKSNPPSQHRYASCLKEMEQITGIINWYDEAVMQKKTWCIAVWAALSAYGLQHANAAIILVGLAAMIGFAASELVLRRYQRRYVVRGEEIDRLLAVGDLSAYQFSLAATPARSNRAQELWYAVSQPHFTLQYGFFTLVSFALVWYVVH